MMMMRLHLFGVFTPKACEMLGGRTLPNIFPLLNGHDFSGTFDKKDLKNQVVFKTTIPERSQGNRWLNALCGPYPLGGYLLTWMETNTRFPVPGIVRLKAPGFQAEMPVIHDTNPWGFVPLVRCDADTNNQAMARLLLTHARVLWQSPLFFPETQHETLAAVKAWRQPFAMPDSVHP